MPVVGLLDPVEKQCLCADLSSAKHVASPVRDRDGSLHHKKFGVESLVVDRFGIVLESFYQWKSTGIVE